MHDNDHIIMDSNNEAEPQGVPESAQVAEMHTLNVPAVTICIQSYGSPIQPYYRAHTVYMFLYLQKFLVAEELVDRSKRPKVEIQSLNTRAYLDHTVVPILLDAMAAVAKERWVRMYTHIGGAVLRRTGHAVANAVVN